MTGIINRIGKFVRYLKEKSKKISFLQLTGLLEDYLVKEYIYFMCSNNHLFVKTNYGHSGEPRIDICFLKKGSNGRLVINGLVESKYITNIHKSDVKQSAQDNMRTTLSCLRKQLKKAADLDKHGKYDVDQKRKYNDAYGLVFVSNIAPDRSASNRAKAASYYKRIRDVARECGLRSHNQPGPVLYPVYDDIMINTLDGKRYVALKIGLWTLRK